MEYVGIFMVLIIEVEMVDQGAECNEHNHSISGYQAWIARLVGGEVALNTGHSVRSRKRFGISCPHRYYPEYLQILES
jgi:hypothetical protein